MRILVATCGSLGDVFPYIGLARGLRQRGHAVTLAAAEYFRSYVVGAGVGFSPLVSDYAAFSNQGDAFSKFVPDRLAKWMVEGLHVRYAEVLALARQADTMVIHSLHQPAMLAARKLGMPWVSATLSNMQLPSRYDPLDWKALMGQAHHLARFPGLGRRAWGLRVPIMRRYSLRWFGEITAFAREQGVPIEDHPFFDAPFSPHGTAALFSSQLTAPRPDWPQGVRITGHIPYSGATQSRLPDAVCHFLDAGSEPIVFVMGSWSAMSAAFFTESADACRRLGRRGLIVAPGIDGLDFGPDVLVTGYLPVDLLFGRAAAIVHHGGMGTLQHAMLAGKVMVVVPHFLDQFGNAWLACRLGTARALQPARYRGATAAAALHALLSDAAAHRRAGAVAAQMRAEDGVAQACAFVETATSGSGRPAACLPA